MFCWGWGMWDKGLYCPRQLDTAQIAPHWEQLALACTVNTLPHVQTFYISPLGHWHWHLFKDFWSLGRRPNFTLIYLTWVIIRFLNGKAVASAFFDKEKVLWSLVGPSPATVKLPGALFPSVLLCQAVTDVVGCWVLWSSLQLIWILFSDDMQIKQWDLVKNRAKYETHPPGKKLPGHQPGSDMAPTRLRGWWRNSHSKKVATHGCSHQYSLSIR